MKILITGNLGYIGPVVVRHLRDVFRGATLIGFDSGFFKENLIDREKFPDERIDEQQIGDVRRISSEALVGVDVVVQLAAISNDPMGKEFERPTKEINADASVQLAKEAKRAGVRQFIFASSCSVYGAGGESAKNEESALDPLTAYARSKVEAEKELKNIADKEFVVTCLRFATACGFSPRMRFDLVLNDFVASALATGRIEILSDGTPWRPLIHVKDMARAIEWAILRQKGEAFLVLNVGSDEWNYQVRQLAAAVQQEIGNTTLSINENAAPDKRSYRVDFSLFKRLAPMHQPRETLHSAVKEIAEKLRSCGFSDTNFRSSEYIRLKVLKDLREKGKLTDSLYWA
ncbi:SDR family oxidoreductase [Candidatus Kaiserbacteria bacterium]|nr:SDR family oxidoreductase [Candidatus Kaiserbacteria bacterium]